MGIEVSSVASVSMCGLVLEFYLEEDGRYRGAMEAATDTYCYSEYNEPRCLRTKNLHLRRIAKIT